MTNTKLLREFIHKSGYKLSYIADVLGVSRQCFLNKITNASEFKAGELRVLRDLLGLSNDDFERIFFAENVD